LITVHAHKLEGARQRLRLVSSSFGLDFFDLGRFPGFSKWNPGNQRQLLIEPTFGNLKHLFACWIDDVEWSDDGCKKYLEDYERMAEEHAATMAAKASDDIPDDGIYKYKTKPYMHQHKCFVISRDLEKFAIFADQGTGKTKIIIDNAAYLWEQDKIDMMVVIAPNGVHRNWCDNEIPAHLPDRIPYKMAFQRPGKTKKQQKLIDSVISDLSELNNELRIYAFNIESFMGTTGRELLTTILNKFRVFLILDESDTIKNHNTMRTKFLIKTSTNVKYKRILTGTPITEGVENLFSQCKWLDPNILGYNTFTTFRNQYCTMGGYQGTQVTGYKNLDELIERIKGFSFRVLKSECLDLPEKIYKLWPVEMATEQKKLFKEMQKEWKTEYEGETLTEGMAISRIIRCQQISAGWWPHKDEDTVKMIPLKSNPKLDALKQLLSLNRGSANIWTRFKADARLINATLGEQCVPYYGDISADARANNMDRFQNDPDIKWMVTSLQTGAAGLTLTAADFVIFYTNHHGLRFRIQAEDRHHRIDEVRNKDRKSIIYYDMSMIGSLDLGIIRCLKEKKQISDYVMQDPPSMFLEFENEYT